jgi:hypothetical protein
MPFRRVGGVSGAERALFVRIAAIDHVYVGID